VIARGSAYLVPISAGLAVVLSSTSLSGVLRGFHWLSFVLLVVGVVVAIGLVLRLCRLPMVLVVPAQLVGLALLLTRLFSTHGMYGVLPGPTALGELGHQLSTAISQIERGIPPVPTTSALALLVSLGFGVVAVGVDPLAVSGHGAATCGLVLLGAYTVPTALAPDPLPGWTLAAGAAGYAVLLLVNHRERQARRGIPTRPRVSRVPDAELTPRQRIFARLRYALRAGAGVRVAASVTAVAVVLALVISSWFTMIGTGGRFSGGHGDNGNPGEFGLKPFAALRGELQDSNPTELLRIRGLPGPEYVRGLTLSKYVPQEGFQVADRRGDVSLNGSLPTGLPVPARNPSATVQFQNVGYRDRWLPLYGMPLGVTGVIGNRWHYDVISGTAYASQPLVEPSWTERAGLPEPNPQALENSPPATDVDPTFLDTSGVAPQIATIAKAVTSHAHTPFDRVVALNRYFLDPASGFHYSLQTPPGSGGDALVDFLTRGKTGYCEQFASAMAVMLRTVGVPSRVAIGFTGGVEKSDYRSISTSDAHAWVEAYLTGFGWLTFDPTPLDDGRTVVPSYVANAPNVPLGIAPSTLAAGQAPGSQPSGQPTPPPAPPPGPAQGQPTQGQPAPNAPVPAQPQAIGGDQSGLRPPPPNPGTGDQGGSTGGNQGSGDNQGPGDDQGNGDGGDHADHGDTPGISGDQAAALLAVGLAMLALLLIGLLAATPGMTRRLLRYRRLRRAAKGGADGAVAAWQELLAEFEDRGTNPDGNDTVRGTARRLSGTHGLDPRLVGSMRTVVSAVERGWYAADSNPGPGLELVSAVATVRGGLDRSAPMSLGARMWPPSVRPKRVRRRRSELS
jgi:transglutaminase-like putative cysteine protease